MNNLHDLFESTLKDIYYAECKLAGVLPKLAKEAENPELSAAISDHADETRQQIRNLEKVFDLLDKKPEGEKCEAIEGLIKEGNGVISEAKSAVTTNLGMIAACQAVEHYEMARYTSLVRWANKMGLKEAADLLGENLDQELAADQKLAAICDDICDAVESEQSTSAGTASKSDGGSSRGARGRESNPLEFPSRKAKR